jgi:hypothetical protein
MNDESFTPVALRPLSLDDIVGESITLLLRYLPQFLALAALANLPVLFWQLLTLIAPDQWVSPPRFQTLSETSSISAFIAYVTEGRNNLNTLMAIGVGVLGSLLQTVGVSMYAYQHAIGRALSLAATMQHTLKQFPAMLLGGVLPMAAIILIDNFLPKNTWGNLFYIVMLLAIYPRFLLVPATVALEDASGPTALWRSLRLVGSAYWRVLVIWLVLELVIAMTVLLPTLFIGLSSINLVLGTPQRLINFGIGNLTIFVVDSFRSIALMLLFVDVRRRSDRQRTVQIAGI